MWGDTTQALAMMFLFSWIPHYQSAPGQPRITSCRSPEKETFTCWWEPGSSEGLPTTHRLFYNKERSDKVLECPDYHSAGNNSCFFNKAHTSIWIIYNITIVASNANGSTFSEPLEVDVMDIVQPHPPENLTVTVVGVEDNPYFLVQWEAPHDTDTRSGWVTLKYEVRVKLENSRQDQAGEWEVYGAGKQRELSIYSPQPGGKYSVQVRCRLDQGLWSEWSPAAFISVPNIYLKEKSVVIFTAATSAFIFLLTVGILVIKRKHVKHCLLPPVPGPKIKGFDAQLLKAEKSEDLFNALTSKGFPPAPEVPDHVDYLVVVDNEEDPEGTGTKAPQEHPEHQKTHQHSSSDPADEFHYSYLSTEEQLNLIHTDRWKRSAFVSDCQYCDPETTCGTRQTFTGGAQTTLQRPERDEGGSHSTSGKTKLKNFDKDTVSTGPNGLEEYVDVTDRQDCKLKPTTEEEEEEEEEGGEENYSKVSGVYCDSVLVLQKGSSTPIQTLTKKNCDDPQKKIKGEKPSTVKDLSNTQDYVGYV
ncbi:prolactin receptor b [Astyanax mexicanus]|uniref:prolactin receptor b n=1 Tax=Astyanax mexicanus TaxID=7994 RepID=UPI0020CAE12A|nr:prolactin receptor b [Astyanax mexicanus]XP_022523349.2 prolactin receptor b [Astyanax mexicanus]